jgi:uncharacterized protein
MAGSGREAVASPPDSQEPEPGRAISKVVRFDLPTPNDETQPYWDAARERRLLLKRCADCGRAHFYPRPFCPYCWSKAVEWEDASGRATLYTWSVVYRNDLPPFHERVPYVAAVVDLEEGPRMMTNVVDIDFDALRIGMPLEVDFRPIADDVTLPVFRPAAAS